jgi:hypothetical protein
MRSTKRLMACLGVLTLLVFAGCASGPIDDADSAHVALQIENFTAPSITGSIEGSGICSGDGITPCTSEAQCASASPPNGSCIGLTCVRTITPWAGSARNVPKNSLANTSPFNDIVLLQVDVSYPAAGIPPQAQGLGSVTVPADGSAPFAFDPITFDALNTAFPLPTDSGSIDVVYSITGRTFSNDTVNVAGSRQLNVETCFD